MLLCTSDFLKLSIQIDWKLISPVSLMWWENIIELSFQCKNMILNSDLRFYSLLLLFVWFYTIYFFRSNVKQRPMSKAQIQHPPSPPALPLIGHLHLLGPALAKSFQALAARYGPLMRLRLGSKSTIIVSNAIIAKEMLKDNEMNFVSRPDVGSTEFYIYGAYPFIFAEYGNYWRFMKKLCMTELLSTAQVNQFADIRREETMKLLETLVKCSEEGKACDLGVQFVTLTNNVICRMTMSTRCSGSDDESRLIWEFVKGVEQLMLKCMISELLGPLSKFDLFGYGKKLKSLITKFDSLVEKLMVEHENDMNSGKKERKDIMDLLLEVYRDDNAEVKLNRTSIKSFFMDLFMAGTDTTSVALHWALAELINRPQAFKKLRDEINSVVGSTRLVEESDIPSLPYLQAVVKETLRLHPSAALIFRRSIEDCKISGYDILANERIIFDLKAIMRDPNSWENPLDFLPERFTTDFKGRYEHYRMDIRGQDSRILPFGSGRRGCPGASLALAIIHGAIATLVQCFDFDVPNGGKLNMEEGIGFSGAMVHPLLCRPIVHLNPMELTNKK